MTTLQYQPLTQTEALTLAAEAVKELVNLKYSQVERWTRMFPTDKIPHQARLDGQRRELLLEVAAMLEAAQVTR